MHMLAIHESFRSNGFLHHPASTRHLSIPGIWQKLAELYDLEALDERENRHAGVTVGSDEEGEENEGDEDEDEDDAGHMDVDVDMDMDMDMGLYMDVDGMMSAREWRRGDGRFWGVVREFALPVAPLGGAAGVARDDAGAASMSASAATSAALDFGPLMCTRRLANDGRDSPCVIDGLNQTRSWPGVRLPALAKERAAIAAAAAEEDEEEGEQDGDDGEDEDDDDEDDREDDDEEDDDDDDDEDEGKVVEVERKRSPAQHVGRGRGRGGRRRFQTQRPRRRTRKR